MVVRVAALRRRILFHPPLPVSLLSSRRWRIPGTRGPYFYGPEGQLPTVDTIGLLRFLPTLDWRSCWKRWRGERGARIGTAAADVLDRKPDIASTKAFVWQPT